MSNSYNHFATYRAGIVGIDQMIPTPSGDRPLLYADWTASGRLFAPLEARLAQALGPYVANTHTETSFTGHAMTAAYHRAREIIKSHIHAQADDVLLATGSGCTAAINKLQRILGLRVPSNFIGRAEVAADRRPLVLITHMEHHSNHTSWLECEVDLEVIPATADGLVDVEAIPAIIARYAERPLKIASVSACSNVTGIATPYHRIAAQMHALGGWCFVDFACSAPYVPIDMHPADPAAALDALFFSPHKFLGGPGSCGILVFTSRLYSAPVPDQPGGGTVSWTNPWHEHRYYEDIETREDGGTPGFLQLIRAALAVQLKEAMGSEAIARREREIVARIFAHLDSEPDVVILAAQHRQRLPVISFYIPDAHYNLVVRLLNDRYGIQARGGCSCAGTYGHFLLNVDLQHSHAITERIDAGDSSAKPGWVRVSFHPTHTDAEIDAVCAAIVAISRHHREWGADYEPVPRSNDYRRRVGEPQLPPLLDHWFAPF